MALLFFYSQFINRETEVQRIDGMWPCNTEFGRSGFQLRASNSSGAPSMEFAENDSGRRVTLRFYWNMVHSSAAY